MKFAATVMHRQGKHTLKEWQERFITSADANFVPSHIAKEAIYGSSVLWAQIEIIGKDWEVSLDNGQIIQTLDFNNFYTMSYLLVDEGSRLIVTKSGHAGFGGVYDINICFVGDEKILDKHLAIANIDHNELTVTQKH